MINAAAWRLDVSSAERLDHHSPTRVSRSPFLVARPSVRLIALVLCFLAVTLLLLAMITGPVLAVFLSF